MANMQDYLAWRGDIPFSASPWNEIDALIAATFSYLDFHGIEDHRGWSLEEMLRLELLQTGNSAAFPNRRDVFEKMAASVRFRGTRVHHSISLTDGEIAMQFSAVCLDLPDGSTCVAFRGTDNTIVGWREDFDMAYQTRVPAQEAAALYLQRAAELSDRPLRLVGHSKGGNLAVYAASTVTGKIRKRIEGIWSFDGPGTNREMSRSDGFLSIRDRIRSFVPQTSIIGMLMDFYEPYTVVHSTASGISQHDPMSWQVYGPCFETVEDIDQTAKVTRETLHEWLQNSTPEQRADFVDTLFRLVDTTKATRMSDLLSEKWKSMLIMVGNRKEVNPETRRVFNRLMAQAVSLGFGNVMEIVRGRRDSGEAGSVPAEDAAAPKEDRENGMPGGEWETMSPEERRAMLETRAARQAAPEEAPSGLPEEDTTQAQSDT